MGLEPPKTAVISPSKKGGVWDASPAQTGEKPQLPSPSGQSRVGVCVGVCPYQEDPLGPSLLPGPGHLWSLGDLQALVVPSVPGALGIE